MTTLRYTQLTQTQNLRLLRKRIYTLIPSLTCHILRSLVRIERMLTISSAVVTDINRCVAACLKATGPAILAQEDMVKETVTVLGLIITRSHPCQQDLGDDEEDLGEASQASSVPNTHTLSLLRCTHTLRTAQDHSCDSLDSFETELC